MTKRTWVAGAAGWVLTAALGCSQDPAALAGKPMVATAAVDVITNPVADADTNYAATCQTGAIVRLMASGSHDPEGQTLTYRWRDRVAGELTPDFGPGRNPLETGDAETGVLLATIGVHDIELTVTASDGRNASTTVTVLVTSCVVCGDP